MMIPKEMVPGLMGKLLDSQDYDVIASELKTDSDIQLLLEYILYVRILSSTCWPSDLLSIATLSRRLVKFWHSRCQPKSQGANDQTVICEKRRT